MALPLGYTELEYIESTGTQYVDTEFNINSQNFQNLRIVADVLLTNVSGSSYWSVSGISGGGITCYLGSSNSGAMYYGNGTQDVALGVTYQAQRMSLELNIKHKSIMVGNIYTGTNITFNTPSASANFYISAYNKSNGQDCHPERIWNYKFYESDKLIKNFVPAKNIDGNIGLFETVAAEFFANKGTGTFIAGPEVEATPETPAEFRQSMAAVLIWQPVDCQGYKIYKNGIYLATTTETVYADTNVSDGQEITYSLTAFNGDYESDSIETTVTIKAGYTILTPIVTSAFFQ